MSDRKDSPEQSLTRRSMVRIAGRSLTLATLAGTLGNLAAVRALGALAGQRSLVCIDLIGGNDSNNLIVPLDSDPYGVYANSRGLLAIPKNSLLPVPSVCKAACSDFIPACRPCSLSIAAACSRFWPTPDRCCGLR